MIDAVIDLLNSGGPIPNASTIAELAGVSSASLFRYFDSIEDLQREAALEHFKRNRSYFDIPDIGVGPLDERIDRFVRARAELYRRTGPVARFGRARALEVPFFAESLKQVRRNQMDQVRVHFAEELDALAGRSTGRLAGGSADRSLDDHVDDVVTNIAALTSFESWELQHHDFDRDDRTVHRAWSSAIRSLLLPGS